MKNKYKIKIGENGHDEHIIDKSNGKHIYIADAFTILQQQNNKLIDTQQLLERERMKNRKYQRGIRW
jgi:hypothetical protein